MGLFDRFKKKIGYRWSIYYCNPDKTVVYWMSCDRIIVMIGYLTHSFQEYGNPKGLWKIYINFNHTNQSLELVKDYFGGELGIKDELLRKIEEIDKDYLLPNNDEIHFIDKRTNRKIDVDTPIISYEQLQKNRENNKKDFVEILTEIFTEQG